MKIAYIANQKDPAVCHLPLGEGQVYGMGCEAIALFNTLVFSGGRPDFDALLDELKDEKLLWRKGKWGMSPHQMKKYLETRGFEALWISSKDLRRLTAEDLLAERESVIVTCFNHDFLKYGVHSFAVLPQEGVLQSPNGYVA